MKLARDGRIVLAAAIVILVASTGVVASRGEGTGTYSVTAYFPRAIGLFKRSTVRVLGVEVGRVTSVVPDGDRVRVGMSIRSGVQVPKDASAVIVPISLISDRYVQLVPVYKGGDALDNGGEIPLERGVAPQELDDLLATLKGFLEAIEPGTPEAPGALGQVVSNTSRALGDSGPQLGQTIDSTSVLLDVLGRNAAHLDATLVSLDRVVSTLGSHDAQIVSLNRGMASVLAALADERDHLEQGVGNLADALDQVGGLVRDHRTDLLADVKTLSDTADVIVRQQDGLLRNVLWLPVLAQAGSQAFDPSAKAVNVRDNQGERAP